MAPPTHPVLQQLHNLNQSSPDFHSKLDSILHGEGYYECTQRLEGGDPAWLVDYLDKAVGRLDPFSSASRKCLRELKTVCGAHTILPSSYALPPEHLNVGPIPFTKGGFGDVYKATYNGSTVCVKRLHVFTQDDKLKADKMFCKEAVMWKHLSHPNVLPLLGVTLFPHQLVSNWMLGGDLSDYVTNNPDADRLGLLHDVAKGLNYLHSRNVIHGDLKGLNILVDIASDPPSACLADFGITIVTKNLDSIRPPTSERICSPRWSAPEILRGESNPSKESDVFSFAMVMVEVFTGRIPYSDKGHFMVLVEILEGSGPQRPTHPACTDLLWVMMQRCWDKDPSLRPDASEILRVLSDSVSI